MKTHVKALVVGGGAVGTSIAYHLARGQPFKGHIAGLGRGGIDHVFVHPRLRLRHAQVADHGETGIEPRFGLERFVEIDRVFVDMGRGKAHVEQRQQPRRVPG